MFFNNRLKELRLQKNLSQEKVAIKLDIATRTYIYYETGKKYPSLKLLTRMAEFFDVSISSLIDERGERVTQTQAKTHEQEEAYEKINIPQLLEEINSLLTGSELSEKEKDALLKNLHKVCQRAKMKNNNK